jgi:hypothetical protein
MVAKEAADRLLRERATLECASRGERIRWVIIFCPGCSDVSVRGLLLRGPFEVKYVAIYMAHLLRR